MGMFADALDLYDAWRERVNERERRRLRRIYRVAFKYRGRFGEFAAIPNKNR